MTQVTVTAPAKVAPKQLWTLDDFGYALSGPSVDAAGVDVSDRKADKLKAALLDGPLACGIHANDKLEAYGTVRYGGWAVSLGVAATLSNHLQ
jgi:hypothetical protein